MWLSRSLRLGSCSLSCMLWAPIDEALGQKQQDTKAQEQKDSIQDIVSSMWSLPEVCFLWTSQLE